MRNKKINPKRKDKLAKKDFKEFMKS